ncbi:unnamed protein product [Alternaria sp. RS040]
MDPFKAPSYLFGSIMAFPHTMVARTIAVLGMDFVMVDALHTSSPIDTENLVRIIQTINFCSEGRTVAVVRVPSAHSDLLTHALDAAVICQIESQLAMENADAIAATHGVDCLMLGPGDLRLSLGLPARKFGQRDDPRFLEAVNRLVEVKHRHGKPLMTVSFKISAEEDSWIQHFNLLLATADFVDVVKGHQTALETIKGTLAGLNERLPPPMDVDEKIKGRRDSHEE